MRKAFLAIGAVLLAGSLTMRASAQQYHGPEPEWGPSIVKPCDRACLVGIMDGYMNAIFKHDPNAVPPLALDVRMTENTAQMDIGEGMLWRSKVEPTSFKIYIADPVAGQVAEQARLKGGGRGTLVAGRLKSDRGKSQEMEQRWAGNGKEAAVPQWATPRRGRVDECAA